MGGVPASIGTATQDLRTTLEDKLREIVESAEARAHEIEDRALANALEIEQDSEQKARERFQRASERADQIEAAIGAFEHEVREALRALRAKAESLASELGAEAPGQPAVEEPAGDGAPSEDPGAAAPPSEGPSVDASSASPAAAAADGAAPAAETTTSAPEVGTTEDEREGVRRRILDLFLAGEPRVEAERMLGRIEDGGRFIDLLDEVYEGRPETQQGSRRRRGGRRRRRPGSP